MIPVKMKPSDKPKLKQLSIEKIETSYEITQWLTQFSDSEQSFAKLILSKLIFVSRDEYTKWLLKAISSLPNNHKYALFSVRKLPKENHILWDSQGEIVDRPGCSLGSEDLVYSIISNLVRSNKDFLIEHPSLNELKRHKIHNYILIDDAIGSGDRVSEFINAMLSNPTFLSWWSLGIIKFTLLSFARTQGSECNIINKIRGSDHGIRKFRKSDKINFISEIVYNEKWLETRWGKQYDEVINLCHKKKQIKLWARLGYGEVLSNIIFYHSVPNNIPGMLWFTNKKWQGLMPDRAIPSWLLDLIENDYKQEISASSPLSPEILKLLTLIKRGMRDKKSLALRLNIDCSYVENLIQYSETLGLLTTQKRLTKVGLDLLIASKHIENNNVWDFSLYIPESWCADRYSIQPLNKNE